MVCDQVLHLHGNVLKEEGPKHIARALVTNKVHIYLLFPAQFESLVHESSPIPTI